VLIFDRGDSQILTRARKTQAQQQGMQQHMQQVALMAICFIMASLGATQTLCQYERLAGVDTVDQA
jgi:hypothetical protein